MHANVLGRELIETEHTSCNHHNCQCSSLRCFDREEVGGQQIIIVCYSVLKLRNQYRTLKKFTSVINISVSRTLNPSRPVVVSMGLVWITSLREWLSFIEEIMPS